MPFGTAMEVKYDVTDHWEITVLNTIPDATEMVLEEGPLFGDLPKEGNQFYIVTIRAKYLGPGSTYFLGDLRLRAIGHGDVVYNGLENSCGLLIPDALSYFELFTNAATEGNQCWQIASDDTGSLLMLLESEDLFNRERTWFSLTDGPPLSDTPTPTATPVIISTPADLVARVKDSVVKVEGGSGLFASSSGSGFIFDVEDTTAFVATNYHVIEDANAVDVIVHNSRTYKALILGWDADRDVAVLSICCSDDFVALPWEEASPAVGDQVVAVGYPRGGSLLQVTATTGEVTSEDETSKLYGFIPHTAPLNPGNSGGPLFSMPDAKVLGINTARGTRVLSFYAIPFQAIKNQMAEWRSQLVVAP